MKINKTRIATAILAISYVAAVSSWTAPILQAQFTDSDDTGWCCPPPDPCPPCPCPVPFPDPAPDPWPDPIPVPLPDPAPDPVPEPIPVAIETAKVDTTPGYYAMVSTSDRRADTFATSPCC
jgi:type II secretory pathway pseudopilin PulG